MDKCNNNPHDDTITNDTLSVIQTVLIFQKWDGTEVAYHRELPCRYVTGYDYRTALILSVFMGMFGIDRFYLGYVFTQ